jgi:hypothetical protein
MYAATDDVELRWGRKATPEEDELITTRLGDVERMIRRRIPDLDARVAAGTINLDDLIQVQADVVLRLVRNPDGYVSETDGDYTYQLSQKAASGVLELTPEEWAILGVVSNRLSILIPLPVMPT